MCVRGGRGAWGGGGGEVGGGYFEECNSDCIPKRRDLAKVCA